MGYTGITFNPVRFVRSSVMLGLAVLVAVPATLVVGGAPADATATSFRQAAIVYSSVEEVVVGRDGSDDRPGTVVSLPSGFAVTDYDLSGDGSTMWVVAYNGLADGGPNNRIRAYRIDVGSTSAQPISFPTLPDSFFGPEVATSHDGGVAYFSVSYSDDSRAGDPREFQFFHSSGGAATLIHDTITLGAGYEDFPLGVPSYLTATSDGSSALWASDEYLWQLTPAGDATPYAARDDVVYNGEEPVRGFQSLDVPADLDVALSTLDVYTTNASGNPSRQPALVAVGSQTQILTVGEVGGYRPSSVGITDDGSRIAYCLGSPQQCYTGDVSGSARAISAPTGRIGQVALGDGAGAIYASVLEGTGSTELADFIESAQGSGRFNPHSGTLTGDSADNAIVSDAADRVIGEAVVASNNIPGLWLLSVADPHTTLGPRVTAVEFRYDDQDDLVVRAHVDDPADLGWLQIRAAKDRVIDPVEVEAYEQNPFYSIRFGASDGWAQVEPGVYQRTVTLSGKRHLIDAAYTLRVTAVNAANNRAAMVEFDLVGSGSAEPASFDGFDGDPATTERLDEDDAVLAAVSLSRARFTDAGRSGTRVRAQATDRRPATYAVLSRDDVFADALAGAPLTANGPMLYTNSSSLTPSTREEIQRAVISGGKVYILGGTAAVSAAVESELQGLGYETQRLAGEHRIATAMRVADEVRALWPSETRVALARAFGTEGNPTAAWADSVTGGAFGAAAHVPILVTTSDNLWPDVDAWLDRDAPSETILLGGTAALSSAVEAAVPNPRRIAGPSRADTAGQIADQLFGTSTSGERKYTIVNGYDEDGWKFGFAAAGLAGDARAPMLVVHPDVIPDATIDRARSRSGTPEVDLAVIGSTSVIPEGIVSELDQADAG